MNFFDPPAMPELSFKEDGLSGWKELKRWAYMNSMEWHKAESEGRHLKLDDVEIERLACFYLMKSCTAYKKAMMDMAESRTIPML